ncbi:MAG: hypothetical protein OJF60_003410 [Burkholderiaceae bacterium]|nr:MAG: hypothetical protein OJF60_003410 [Burkholderiaceae bacterium]
MTLRKTRDAGNYAGFKPCQRGGLGGERNRKPACRPHGCL